MALTSLSMDFVLVLLHLGTKSFIGNLQMELNVVLSSANGCPSNLIMEV